MDNKDFLYVYNFKQAKFFANMGLPIIEIGKGKKGDIFLKFMKDEKSAKLYNLWKTMNPRGYKADESI